MMKGSDLAVETLRVFRNVLFDASGNPVSFLGIGYNEFYCYRYKRDVPKGWKISILRDPFPTPEREERTQKRGRFRLNFTLTD